LRCGVLALLFMFATVCMAVDNSIMSGR
jgi:hypothetical protein